MGLTLSGDTLNVWRAAVALAAYSVVSLALSAYLLRRRDVASGG